MKNQLYNSKEASFKLPFFISYFITDTTLNNSLDTIFHSNKIDIVCLRDKLTPNIKEVSNIFIEQAREANIPLILINSYIDIAIEQNYDGVHLTSTQFDLIKKAKLNNLFTIISCHNESDIQKAYSLGANGVTYSPIFYKKDKGKPKGIENLKKVVKKFQKDDFIIIALGGIISDKEVKLIRSTDAKGFASIRYFDKID